MFGILRPARETLSNDSLRAYGSLYCNLCGSLSEIYGVSARAFVVYDIVSLAWMFQGGDALSQRFVRNNCLRGGSWFPVTNEAGALDEFLSAISILICGIKVEDDVRDGGSRLARATQWAFRSRFEEAERNLNRLRFPVDALWEALENQRALEARNESDLQAASEPTAACYGLVSTWIARFSGNHTSAATALEIGRALGRLIYLVDAFVDRHSDVGHGYNPLLVDQRGRAMASAETRLQEFGQTLRSEVECLVKHYNEAGDPVGKRCRSLLEGLIGPVKCDRQSVILNLSCLVPCGEAFVSVTSENVCNTIGCCCCLCVCCSLSQ